MIQIILISFNAFLGFALQKKFISYQNLKFTDTDMYIMLNDNDNT